MSSSKNYLTYLLIPLVFACSSKVDSKIKNDVAANLVKNDSIAGNIIKSALIAHGSYNLIEKTLRFTFRDINYTAFKGNNKYIYTRSWENDTVGFVQDSLVNSTEFSRHIDGKLQPLTEEWQLRYANSINSVLYFTLLPLGLQDEAAIKTYLGIDSLKGQNYHKIKVTFAEEGGGEDHDDIYCYWINTSSFLIDYLGYEFSTNGGGTRFRVAIDTATIAGVVFQNYINYKAIDESISILDHDQLYEKDSLIELSRIINTNLTLE